MSNFRIDEFNCTSLCAYYNNTPLCGKGFFIETLTESGTCTSQKKGTSLSFTACKDSYVSSYNTGTYSSTARPFKAYSETPIDKSYFPITIMSGINDDMVFTMDGIKEVITLGTGIDLVPTHVADDVEHKLREYTTHNEFYRARCEFINNKFEISSPYVSSELRIHKEGTANETLGFSVTSDTLGSGISSSNTGSGTVSLSQVDKRVRVLVDGQTHRTSMIRTFQTLPTGTVEFDWTPINESHMVAKLVYTNEPYCHLYADNSDDVSMTKSFTTVTGFYFEATARYEKPDGYSNVLVDKYIAETKFFKAGTANNLFYYDYERDYYKVGHAIKYMWTGDTWNTIALSYHPTIGYINYYLNNDMTMGLQHPRTRNINYPFTGLATDEGTDKLRYKIYNEEGNAWIESLRLYNIDYEDLIALDDYSSSSVGDVPPNWTVTSGTGDIEIDYHPVTGGRVVQLSGTDSYLKRTFTACDTLRTGFRIYIPSTSSGSAFEFALLNGTTENFNVRFNADQTITYNGANALPSGTSYVFNEWYFFEAMPDCTSGTFNFCRLGDPENTHTGWEYIDRGHTMSLLDTTDIDTIRFKVITATGTGLCYLNDVLVEDLDLGHDSVLSDDFESNTIGQPPAGWSTQIRLHPDHTNQIVVAQDPQDASNKVAKIESHRNRSIMFQKFSGKSKVRIKNRFYMDQAYSVTEVKRNNALVLQVSDERLRYLTYRGGLAWEPLETLGEGTEKIRNDGAWYTRDMIVDCNLVEYSLYQDWQCFGRRERLKSEKHYGGVNTISFSGYSDYDHYTGDLYIDDVSICEVDDLVDDDFNTIPLDTAPSGWTVSGTVLVRDNPSNGGKVIKIEDTSNDDYSSIYRSFTSNEFVIIKFSVMAETQGVFKIRVGDSATNDYEPLVEIVSAVGYDRGNEYKYASKRHGSYKFHDTEYGTIYNNEIALPPRERFARVKRGEWYDFEIHACITDGLPYYTMKIDGELLDRWSTNFVGFKYELPNFGLTKFDYMEITTDSYFYNPGLNRQQGAIWTKSGSHKNTLYVKDISIQTEKKGSLIWEEEFSIGDLNAPPTGWTVDSGTGNGYIQVETKSEEDDYNAAVSLWSTVGVSDLKGDTFTSLGQNLVEGTSYNIKIDFDCGAGSYDVRVNNSTIASGVSFYSPSSYISTFYFIHPPHINYKLGSTWGEFDNFKVYDGNGTVIINDNFEADTLGEEPSFWNVTTISSSVSVIQGAGLESNYIGNTDDFYSVIISNGSNTLIVDSYEDENTVWAEKSFTAVENPTISINFLIGAEREEYRYIKILSANNDDLVHLRFDYDIPSLQFYDSIRSTWKELETPVVWQMYRWYDLTLEINTDPPYECNVKVDNISRDNISLMTKNKTVGKIRFYKDTGSYFYDEFSFCIGEVEVTVSGSQHFSEDWSSYSLNTAPGSWSISGTQVRIKQNPYFMYEGTLINAAVPVNEEFVDVPTAYGDYVSSSANDFYITFNTASGRVPNPPGICPVFTVSDDNAESVSGTIGVLYYDYPYRITKEYNANGDIYLTFPEGMVFNDDIQYKVHCDASYTVSGASVGAFKVMFSSEKGDYSTYPLTPATGTDIELGSRGLSLTFEDAKTYNDDIFYFNAYSVYPTLFDLGNDVSAGTIFIGERSDIKCIRFTLKEGFLKVSDDVGINTISWPINKIGTTKLAFAFTNIWPERLVTYDDFDNNYTATNDWITVPSGSEYTLYRDSTRLDKSNYIFFYVKIDEDDRGAGDIEHRYYYDSGDYV